MDENAYDNMMIFSEVLSDGISAIACVESAISKDCNNLYTYYHALNFISISMGMHLNEMTEYIREFRPGKEVRA